MLGPLNSIRDSAPRAYYPGGVAIKRALGIYLGPKPLGDVEMLGFLGCRA